MLKTKKLMTAVCAALIGFAFVGCDFNAKINIGKGDSLEPKDIDFTSYPAAEALITVKNNASSNMVLFNGLPSNGEILGGVKAGAKTTLKRTATFSKSTDFIVYVVTAAAYEENKEDLKVLDAAPYTSFMAVYNDNASNTDFFYPISSALNGTNKLLVNNPTKYNLELRNMGLEGETLCFIRKGTYQVSYNLDRAAVQHDGQVMFFPVFRKYDSNVGEIFDIYPEYTTGPYAGQPKFVLISFDDDNSKFEMNANDWINGVKFCPSATYIEIINNSDMALKFYDGKNSTALETSSHGIAVNTGKKNTYAINMTQISERKYSEEVTLGGYRLGNNMANNIYIFGDLTKGSYSASDDNASRTQTLVGGKIYSFTITGGMEEGYTITPLTEEITKTEKVLKTAAYTDDEGVEHEAVYEDKETKTVVLKARDYEF